MHPKKVQVLTFSQKAEKLFVILIEMMVLLFFYFFASAELPGLGLILDKNQQAGITEYKRALGGNVNGGGNFGIVDYNFALLQSNPCFRTRAVAFYNELKEVHKVQWSENNLKSKLPDGPLNPGYLWQLAMKHAGDDPNLAMALIGICGHDNMNQLGGGSVLSMSDYRLECPTKELSFYTPGSLAENATISESLQKRIGQLQGNNGDDSFIPAKYYHVIGAASTSCLMLRRGVPAAMARTAVTAAVNAYRVGRLCEDLNQLAKSKAQVLENLLDGSLPMPVPAIPGPENNFDIDELLDKMYDGYEKSVQETLENNAHIFMAPPDIAKKKLQRQITFINAQQIIFKNKKIAKECQVSPHISMSLVQYLKNNEHRKSTECPKDMTAEDCKEALHRIDTWAVDREWTEAQHLAGFEFAKNNCKANYNDDGALERSACRAGKKSDSAEYPKETGVSQ